MEMIIFEPGLYTVLHPGFLFLTLDSTLCPSMADPHTGGVYSSHPHVLPSFFLLPTCAASGLPSGSIQSTLDTTLAGAPCISRLFFVAGILGILGCYLIQ